MLRTSSATQELKLFTLNALSYHYFVTRTSTRAGRLSGLDRCGRWMLCKVVKHSHLLLISPIPIPCQSGFPESFFHFLCPLYLNSDVTLKALVLLSTVVCDPEILSIPYAIVDQSHILNHIYCFDSAGTVPLLLCTKLPSH